MTSGYGLGARASALVVESEESRKASALFGSASKCKLARSASSARSSMQGEGKGEGGHPSSPLLLFPGGILGGSHGSSHINTKSAPALGGNERHAGAGGGGSASLAPSPQLESGTAPPPAIGNVDMAKLQMLTRLLAMPGVGKVQLLRAGGPAEMDEHLDHLIALHSLEEPFYVMDVGLLIHLFKEWQAALPRVTPFYAVKCSPEPVLLATLAALGAGFDCASKAEISQVLGTGVGPERIIFANPCKMPAHMTFAAQAGVHLTTFDSEAELFKLKRYSPEARLLLRIRADDQSARCPLGAKYGALPAEVAPLLHTAACLGLQVAGVSFHVGSGASDPSAHATAIAMARAVFGMATAAGLPPMQVLDIGGGFTARRSGRMAFPAVAAAINAALNEHFPAGCGVSIIAEPGRYFAETTSTLATTVFGRRERGDHREYWANDGLYGSMNCLLYDHAVLAARPLLRASVHEGDLASSASDGNGDDNDDADSGAGSSADADSGARAGAGKRGEGGGQEEDQAMANSATLGMHCSTVFGPTCDGLDVILHNVWLPDLAVGDWLVFANMGAYTAAAGSSFNGFSTSAIRTFYVLSVGEPAGGKPRGGGSQENQRERVTREEEEREEGEEEGQREGGEREEHEEGGLLSSFPPPAYYGPAHRELVSLCAGPMRSLGGPGNEEVEALGGAGKVPVLASAGSSTSSDLVAMMN